MGVAKCVHLTRKLITRANASVRFVVINCSLSKMVLNRVNASNAHLILLQVKIRNRVLILFALRVQLSIMMDPANNVPLSLLHLLIRKNAIKTLYK